MNNKIDMARQARRRSAASIAIILLIAVVSAVFAAINKTAPSTDTSEAVTGRHLITTSTTATTLPNLDILVMPTKPIHTATKITLPLQGSTKTTVVTKAKTSTTSAKPIKTTTEKMTSTTHATPIVQETSGNKTYHGAYNISDKEMTLLCNIVYGESGNQSDACQRAVCSVIINRFRAGFASSITGVIYAPGQFTGGKSKTSDRVRSNVEYVLKNGCTLPSYVLYFNCTGGFKWAKTYTKIGTETFCYKSGDTTKYTTEAVATTTTAVTKTTTSTTSTAATETTSTASTATTSTSTTTTTMPTEVTVTKPTKPTAPPISVNE